MLSTVCRRCGIPTDDLGLRADAIFCSSLCRSRFHTARDRALIGLVLAQCDAINNADFSRLERLLDEARSLVPLN